MVANAIARAASWTLSTDESRERVVRMAEGDASAAAEIYELHGQRLYAYALRLTREAALAEDVMQEALLVAWRTAGRYRGESQVRTWLLGIVHHIALKALRRRPAPLPDEVAAGIRTEMPSPEQAAESSQTAACVRRAIDSLSLKHRMVLELVFYQGLTLEEAAEVCGCPAGTIKSRLAYAKESLRGALERAGIGLEVR